MVEFIQTIEDLSRCVNCKVGLRTLICLIHNICTPISGRIQIRIMRILQSTPCVRIKGTWHQKLMRGGGGIYPSLFFTEHTLHSMKYQKCHPPFRSLLSQYVINETENKKF